jgi:hypothetical protein
MIILRPEIRHEQLLDDLQERGSYWKLKEEALERGKLALKEAMDLS